jgi:hypothetical protein
MACGILPIPQHNDLLLRDPSKPTEAQLLPTFRYLKLIEGTVETLLQSLSHKSTEQALPDFADLLGLWTGWLPTSVNGMSTVESPFPVEVESMGRRPESRVVWRYFLHQDPLKSHKIKRILGIYDQWESFGPTQFQTLHHVEVPLLGNVNRQQEYSTKLRPFLKSVFDEIQTHFYAYPHFSQELYQNVMKVHVEVNAQSLTQAEEKIRAGLKRPHQLKPQSTSQYQGDPIFTERAFVYVENIPEVVSKVGLELTRSRYQVHFSSTMIEDAWWMMMLRMQVWDMSVNLVMREGLTIPYQYYGDPSTVYIL